MIPRLAQEVDATEVHVTAETTPYGRRRDARVAARLAADGRRLVATGTPYAVGPGRLLTGAGTPYQVFTPFSRAWRATGGRRRAATMPGAICRRTHARPARSPRWRRWQRFLDEDLEGYADGRDRPDLDSTSRMSVHLKLRRDPPAHDARRPGRGIPTLRARGRRASSPSCAGASSTPTCSGTSRARRGTTCAASSPRWPTTRDPRSTGWSTPGGRVGPATRSSTPACGSCWPRAGCTTGSGWSPRASWSRTCTCGGRWAPGTSSTTCSTATSRRTTTAGSGWPAPAPTRRRTSGCSTRSPRAERFDPDGRLRAPLGARAAHLPGRRGPRAVARRPTATTTAIRGRSSTTSDERREALERYHQARNGE